MRQKFSDRFKDADDAFDWAANAAIFAMCSLSSERFSVASKIGLPERVQVQRMKEIVIKRFDAADNSPSFDKGHFETIDLNGTTLGMATYEPFPDGTVHEMHQGDAFFIAGEHDSWVIGEKPYVSIHIAGARSYIP